jgi:hypothetical protein
MDLAKVTRRTRRRQALLGCLFGACLASSLGRAVLSFDKPGPAGLSHEHSDPSGSYSFRTPSGWTVDSPPARPDMVEAEGDGMVVRFLHRPDDSGFDSLHVACMQDRLTSALEVDPRVSYEYDFAEGMVGATRVLDSAFRTHYDKPVKGYREWRQRTITLVGAGRSLCIIAYCPTEVWKKSGKARALLESVVMSVSTR